jgi:GH15 family glucan-1,4-alpha-glucosidase
MLDRDAGFFRIAPLGVSVPASRRYLPGTMVLETTWGTSTGWAVVRDVLLVGPWRHGSARSETHLRAPLDHSAERVLLRTARCLQGTVDFVLECEPAFDYGRQRGAWRYTGDGYGQAEALAGAEPQFRLTTDLNLGFEGPSAIARRRLRAGEQVFCALSWQDGAPPETFAAAHERLSRTATATSTTASRGCAMRRSCSGACTRWALTGKPTTSSTSSPISSSRTRTCRSCTGSAASGN